MRTRRARANRAAARSIRPTMASKNRRLGGAVAAMWWRRRHRLSQRMRGPLAVGVVAAMWRRRPQHTVAQSGVVAAPWRRAQDPSALRLGD